MSQPESENCRYCLEPLDCELGDILIRVNVKVKYIKNVLLNGYIPDRMTV